MPTAANKFQHTPQQDAQKQSRIPHINTHTHVIALHGTARRLFCQMAACISTQRHMRMCTGESGARRLSNAKSRDGKYIETH